MYQFRLRKRKVDAIESWLCTSCTRELHHLTPPEYGAMRECIRRMVTLCTTSISTSRESGCLWRKSLSGTTMTMMTHEPAMPWRVGTVICGSSSLVHLRFAKFLSELQVACHDIDSRLKELQRGELAKRRHQTYGANDRQIQQAKDHFAHFLATNQTLPVPVNFANADAWRDLEKSPATT